MLIKGKRIDFKSIVSTGLAGQFVDDPSLAVSFVILFLWEHSGYKWDIPPWIHLIKD